MSTSSSVVENQPKTSAKLYENQCCDNKSGYNIFSTNSSELLYNVIIFQWQSTRACMERHNKSLSGSLMVVTWKVWHLSHPNYVQLLPKPRLGQSSLGGDWWHSPAEGVGWRRLVCGGAQTQGGMIWNSHIQDWGRRRLSFTFKHIYINLISSQKCDPWENTA